MQISQHRTILSSVALHLAISNSNSIQVRLLKQHEYQLFIIKIKNKNPREKCTEHISVRGKPVGNETKLFDLNYKVWVKLNNLI